MCSQNAGNAISEAQILKISWEACPPTPLANSCMRQSSHTFGDRILCWGRARKMGTTLLQFSPTTEESLKKHWGHSTWSQNRLKVHLRKKLVYSLVLDMKYLRQGNLVSSAFFIHGWRSAKMAPHGIGRWRDTQNFGVFWYDNLCEIKSLLFVYE
jgi:hypothetical protein